MSQCTLLHPEFDVLDYFGKICKSETTIMNFVEESVKTVDNLKNKYFEIRKRVLDPLLTFACNYPQEILHYTEWKKLKEDLIVCEQQLQARAILKKNDKDGEEAQRYDTEKRKRDTIVLQIEGLQTKFNRDFLQDIENRKQLLSKDWDILVQESGLRYNSCPKRKVLECLHWASNIFSRETIFWDCEHQELLKVCSDLEVFKQNLRFLPKRRTSDLNFTDHGQTDEEMIKMNVKFLRIEIMEVKIYLMEQLSVQHSLKQLEDMKSKIKDLERENEDLKKLVTIVELRHRLEDIVKEQASSLNLSQQLSTPTAFLKHFADTQNVPLNQEWNAIEQSYLQNLDTNKKTRIRQQINQLYGQLSGEIHDPQNNGFDYQKKLVVDRSHIGNNPERYLALKIIFQRYQKDSSLYEDQNGTLVLKQDVDFQ